MYFSLTGNVLAGWAGAGLICSAQDVASLSAVALLTTLQKPRGDHNFALKAGGQK